jgi:AsmA protein
MGRLLKILLIVLAGLVGLLVIAAIGLLIFFDPNDYRDEIAAEVEKTTGRELTIEGELSLSVFPWLAVEIGRTRLANAQGFGQEPFASFERAELSVRLLPLILRRELAVGTAALDSLVLNLEVAANGDNNWDDLAAAGEEPAAPESEETAATQLDIAGVEVENATIHYTDAQAGSAYAVNGLTLATGRIATGTPFEFDAEFDFTANPGELGGHLALAGKATIGEEMASFALENFEANGQLTGIAEQPADFGLTAPAIAIDTNEERVAAGTLELTFLDVHAAADIEPFSYAGTPQPKASLRVQPFSLKGLLQALGTEPPVTADPAALTRVAFEAKAAVGEETIALTSLALQLDDTTLNGNLSWPLTEKGVIRFDFAADSIDLDRYMAPGGTPVEAESASNTDQIEIPVEMIRAFQAVGSAKLERATLTGMEFRNLEAGVNNVGGKLRLHPLRAELFEGTYQGDVRIDASGRVPSIAVDEKIEGVSLTPLAQAMFEQENISGTIAGSFQLRGRGANVGEIKSDLDGKMAFQLADGAWEGTDVWYQLRAARALFRKEPPPEQEGPPRTEFSSVVATGTVEDGLFRNDDLLAELPFLRLTGKGNVDLVKGTVDYRLQARVLERPEFVDAASEAELEDFTEAVIPVLVSGSLASPKIRPDIEGMLKSRVEEEVEKKKDELKDRLLNELFGEDEEQEENQDQQPDRKKELENRLRNLLDQG